MIINKLNLTLILIFCITFLEHCHAGTNIEKSQFTIVLNNSLNDNKSQTTQFEPALIGKWFIPHAADINITFNKDSTFVFNDFNIKTGEIEVLHGKYELNGNKLILKYDGKSRQIFKFKKRERNRW